MSPNLGRPRIIVPILSICILSNAFLLYHKHQSISACHAQLIQLDALEQRINNTKK